MISETQKKALSAATVIIVIGVTPTLFDAYDAWNKYPKVRPLLIAWYAFVIGVALVFWKVLT